MALFNEQESRFVLAIKALISCNHFRSERHEIEHEALGGDYIDLTKVWSMRRDDKVLNPNVEPLCDRSREIAQVLRERIKSGVTFDASEQQSYSALIYFLLYHDFREELLNFTRKSESSSIDVEIKPIYKSFLRDYTLYFGHSELDKFPVIEPAQVFSVFYQIRRAFYFIFYYIIGSSKPSARLRAAVWESIFTHDFNRYLRLLYKRMGNISTLITGKSGTGKELVARAIAFSRFIPFDPKSYKFAENYTDCFRALNLSALTSTLIESELFGHRKGAFTGALSDHVGYLESCSLYGTVFLDEIGELEPAIQVKLLRILQQRRFNRLGETAPRQFSGKIMAATNRDLATEMRSGTFREDLYYRICADHIHTPTLKEQLDDSPEELYNLILYIAENETDAVEAPRLAEQARDWIVKHLGADYHWPGNFRELEQCIRNIMIRNEYHPPATAKRGPSEDFCQAALDGTLTADELLKHYCTMVYSRSRNYQQTARILGIDHRTVKNHIDPALLARLTP